VQDGGRPIKAVICGAPFSYWLGKSESPARSTKSIAAASCLQSQEPSVAKWDKLVEHLTQSNRAQADHIARKTECCRLYRPEKRNATVTARQFTPDEVEIMAELERACWNVARLLDGWKWGPIKDVAKKVSPYIVPWSALPEEAKELDREAVRDIPHLLAEIGLEIVRIPASKRKPSRRTSASA